MTRNVWPSASSAPHESVGDWAPRGSLFFEPGIVAEVRYLAGSLLRHATLRSLAFDQPAEVPEP